jgi:hypothetical protein
MKWLIIFCLLVIGLLQQGTETPESLTVNQWSILVEDTCNPPCMFGMTPGQTTAAEIEAILASLDAVNLWIRSENPTDVIDAATGYIINGSYAFSLRKSDADPGLAPVVRLILEDSILREIRLDPQSRRINLMQVLEVLSQPNQARLLIGPYNTPFLNLVYLEPPMRLMLQSHPVDCVTSNIESSFQVIEMNYYSEEAAMQLVRGRWGGQWLARRGELQPQILAYETLTLEKFIPPEIWQAWLDGEVEVSCGEAWGQLDDDAVLSPLPYEATEQVPDGRKAEQTHN